MNSIFPFLDPKNMYLSLHKDLEDVQQKIAEVMTKSISYTVYNI
jgi:hypothetical protein